MKKMVLCAAYGCNSRSDRGDKISFHQFPKDNKLRKLWIAKINRGESAVKLFKPTHHYVRRVPPLFCSSKHHYTV